MAALIIKNAKLHITSEEFAETDQLGILDHRIVPTDSNLIADGANEEIDVQGMHVAPGFIDLLVNGCNGVSFTNEVSVDCLEIMRRYLGKFGTTTFVPTLVSCPRESLTRAMAAIAEFKEKHPGICPGIHLEGPFINPLHKGFHASGFIRQMGAGDMDFLKAHADAIAYITLAPEMVKPQFIIDLIRHQIPVSLGHTATSYNVAIQTFKAGVNNITHIYNGMRPPIGRDPGVMGALYTMKKIYASVIADGKHVHPALVNVAHQLLDKRLYIVSDCQAAAGMTSSNGSFVVNGTEIFIDEKRGLIDAKGSLAGTEMTLIDGVRFLVESCNFTLEEALSASSEIPAQVLGLKENGRIEGGFIADLVIFDDDFRVHYVVQNGFLKSSHEL